MVDDGAGMSNGGCHKLGTSHNMCCSVRSGLKQDMEVKVDRKLCTLVTRH